MKVLEGQVLQEDMSRSMLDEGYVEDYIGGGYCCVTSGLTHFAHERRPGK